MERVIVNKPQPLDAAAKRDLTRVQTAVGASLRRLRHEREMTIEQLAEHAGLHANYVGSVERGERNVTVFNLWRLAAGLGLKATTLLEELPDRNAKTRSAKQSGV